MKTIRLFAYLLILLGVSVKVLAGVDHWEFIRDCLDKGTPEAYSELNSYIESLDVNELIEAGRQCSFEADKLCPEAIFCEKTLGYLYFFFESYPKKNGLSDIDQILDEIENGKRNNFWRASLIDFLGQGDWLSSLSLEQKNTVIDRLLVIVSDSNEHPVLRYYAIETIDDIIKQVEKDNLLADPYIQEKLKKGYELNKLREDVFRGDLTLSVTYKNAEGKLLKVREQYVNKLLHIIDERNLHSRLQRGVLKKLKKFLNYPIPSAIKIHNALEKYVRNYKQFDTQYWPYLAEIGYENLQMDDICQITKEMYRDLKVEYENENNKNNRLQLNDDVESLGRIIKKYSQD